MFKLQKWKISQKSEIGHISTKWPKIKKGKFFNFKSRRKKVPLWKCPGRVKNIHFCIILLGFAYIHPATEEKHSLTLFSDLKLYSARFLTVSFSNFWTFGIFEDGHLNKIVTSFSPFKEILNIFNFFNFQEQYF